MYHFGGPSNLVSIIEVPLCMEAGKETTCNLKGPIGRCLWSPK